MSLRTDVHTAFDVIAPPTGGLAERIVETARREARLQRRRRFMLRIRAPFSLVAALLIIVIVVAVVVGSRLFQGWQSQHVTVPAGHTITLAELESRPWQHALVAPDGQCAGDEINGVHQDNDPLWVNPTAGPFTTSWGEYSRGVLTFEKGFTGLAILRLRDGQTGKNDFFLFDNAGGPVVGTVTIDGQTVEQHAEAVFNLSDPKVRADKAGNKAFKMSEGHLNGWSPCFEWQLDGTYQGRAFVWHWYFYG